MLLIRQSEAAAQILDADMRQWVENQFRVLQGYGTQWQPDELGWFAVWGEGDDPYDKGLFLGVRSLLKSPCDPELSFEIVEDHGHFYTAVILLSDLLSVEVLIPKGLSLPSEMSTRLAQWSPQ
ncbi:MULTISPECIES: hypothetical protein [Pseudomonas]|uniref:Uncharacterized protein n=2 Tax=Pseudomonas TaxID=286 RepID=A0A0W0HFT1_PSEFL|nr:MULTISPECIES: hypothetical protein [Pseudomonas]KTB59607.1 hypothetical protein AO063_03250 [Pseudomonas fluorescens ICMP 11288]RMQ89556.1 hypothetical protein ALP97_200296 [Pseudomonas salomonii]